MADLITLAEYKLIEGINKTDDDIKNEFLIDAVSKLVRNYCQTDFDSYAGSPGKTDIFDIQWNTHIVQLTEAPVLAISNVYERLAQSQAYVELYRNGTNDKYEWFHDTETDSILRTNEAGTYKNWPCGVGSVKVVYSAGYATIPDDLTLAVADLITYYAKNEHKQLQSIGATTREGAPITVVGDTGFPDHIRRVLDLYKHV